MQRKPLGLLMAVSLVLVLLGCESPSSMSPDTAINLSAIAGVTAPIAGATPVTTITGTDQYTGTVTWSDSPTTFAYSKAYTATITLTAKTGYTLTGVTANFFTVAGASNVSNTASSGVIIAVFPATTAAPDMVISIAGIAGVTAPVPYGNPVKTIMETDQYTGTVTWSDTPAFFTYGKAYTATITLTAKTGYTLSGVTANFFTVAGASSVSNIANSGVVTAVFPATEDAVIYLSAIAGVTAPVAGATPVTTITGTDQYTGTVTWSDTPATFAYSKAYTATITLTAKTGYTLTGVTANFFTVAGASSVKNSASSGTVTAVFPATTEAPDTVINLAAIAGVTAPVTGATPVTTIAGTTQYSGTVAWSPSVPTTFWSGTTYTATITLTAKTGYTLSGVAANFFTVAGASSVTNTASSSTVTAMFAATAANTAAAIDVTSTNIGTLKAVQGGTFNNGTANMTVSSFRISQYEITRSQFSAIMGTDPSNTTCSSGTSDPVQNVSWYQAIAFCNKLSLAEGLSPVYAVPGVDFRTLTYARIPNSSDITWGSATADWSANGYRLPTEAEWQFAARGGNSSNNYTYAGSNTVGDVAWYYTNASSITHPVGGKTSNELGLYDMSGNVSEWCWDLYGKYPATAQIDYRGVASSAGRVFRGGNRSNSAGGCTVAGRGGYDDGAYQNRDIGFRVVRP